MKPEPFVETDCKIEHADQTFEAGGAFLLPASDGRFRGVVYVAENPSRVTTWHGETIAPAELGHVYRGPFCRMQSVRFHYKGILFFGRYCPDWAQMVRVRSSVIKKPSES